MQIIDSMHFGGAEVLLRDLTHGLLERGYWVDVCYSTPGPIAEEIKAMGVSIKRLQRFFRIDPFLLLQIYQAIRQAKPQIVHTHLFKSDFHGRIAARLAKVPVVISTLHNCHAWAKRPLLGWTYGLTARFADEIIAVSDEVRDYALRYAFLDAETVVTIPNAIPINRFVDTQPSGLLLRKELGLTLETPLVGIVARLTEQKNHLNFLRAVVLILEQFPETRFLIVGDGPLRVELEILAVELKISHAVIFTGVRKDIPAVFGALDLLVFSSKWEGLPVALLEGMAASLPIVATKVGGIPGVLSNNVTGLLVPSDDPIALANACIRLLKNPELRKRMGEAGNVLVRENYNMKVMVEKTVSLYQTLLRSVRS